MINVKNSIVFTDNRVFVDIGKGCGFACEYCYCDEAKMKQEPYSEYDIKKMVDYISDHSKFKKGLAGTVISLCPHTEPLMTEKSRTLVLYLIKKLAPYGNMIQIATKAIIPESFLEEINNFTQKGQLVIFVSISSIFHAKENEPYSPSLEDRLDNIRKCNKYGVSNCLYVKPFFIKGKEEHDELNKVIERYKPQTVCTGIVYDENNVAGDFLHPTNSNISSKGINNEMVSFRNNNPRQKFLTSSCVLASINNVVNNVDIPQDLCVKCSEKCYSKKWVE